MRINASSHDREDRAKLQVAFAHYVLVDEVDPALCQVNEMCHSYVGQLTLHLVKHYLHLQSGESPL